MLRFADADPENDVEFQRASWVLDKAAIHHYRTGKAGVGRPPVVDAAKAAELFRTLPSVRAVARELGATRWSVRRALARAGVRKFRTVAPVRAKGED